MINKQVNNIEEAVKGVKSGMTIMFGIMMELIGELVQTE